MGLSENGVQQLMSYHPLQCFFHGRLGYIFSIFRHTKNITVGFMVDRSVVRGFVNRQTSLGRRRHVELGWLP